MSSNKNLSHVFDNISTMLEAGVPIERVLRVSADQAGSRPLARALHDARDLVAGGTNLTDALQSQECLPSLAIHLIEAGEASGHTEQVCAELSDYYEFQHQMWKTFLGNLLMPALQYVLAIFVLALLQYVMSMIAGDGGIQAASLTLVIGYGIPVGLVSIYFLSTRLLQGSAMVHKLLLSTPVIKDVARSLALARFSLVMHIMLTAGIPVVEASQKAFEATGNTIFSRQSSKVEDAVQEGSDLANALAVTELFPRQYLEVVSVAEESGTLSERFEWLAREHQKKARRYLSGMMTVLSYVIWALVAGFIIVSIFSIAAGYIGKINQLTSGP